MKKMAFTKDTYLKNEWAFGTILFKICKEKFGEEFLEWEIDTTNKELFDLGVPPINIDKVLSLVALNNSLDGRFNFFNELHCFRHTVNALNNLEPNAEFLGALVPQHIVWAIYEIGLEYPEYKLDEEPAKFLGLSFHESGYLVLPELLGEYQEFLDYYNKNSELVPKIKEYWKANKDKDLESLDEDNLLDMQVLMLRSNQAYFDYKLKMYENELSVFNS